MDIQSLATPLVVRAGAAETLLAAARRMWAHEIGVLPVFRGERLVGIITERELVTAIALGAGPDAAVAGHMRAVTATVEVHDNPAAAAIRMRDLGARYLVVLDGEQAIGLVSAQDLLPLVADPDQVRVKQVAASA